MEAKVNGQVSSRISKASRTTCVLVGFEGGERGGVAYILREAVPGIGGSQGEKAQSLKRTGVLRTVEGDDRKGPKVMGRDMAENDG